MSAIFVFYRLSTMSSTTTSKVILRPRPYDKFSGRLMLLPLLPIRKPPVHLPSEVWARILDYVLDDTRETAEAWNLLLVNKELKEIALPLLYHTIRISHLSSLDKLYKHLHECDEKWDSIRRIPYSAPGRWVQVLDLSQLEFTGRAQALKLDSLLTQLFPLLPHLAKLSLNPSFVMSRRPILALADRWESQHLRSLCGITYVPSATGQDEPILKLVASCPNLEELEVIGGGPDPTELDFASSVVDESIVKTLNLPHLHTLSLISLHHSTLLMSLLQSPLPSLRKLTVTPYDDVPFPASLVSQLIFTHGRELKSLLLFTPKSWPTRLHPSPVDLLSTCPQLRHLSLENPLPVLRLEPGATHPLRMLSIPRPASDWWPVLEKLLPRLPELCVLRMRDVRWLRKGVAGRAQEAGLQGQMKAWGKRLARYHIQVVDADWKSMADRA
ncbi:hypothetical protein K525DRAFT_361957 [Schizophyllum commune Loenen D]|nr:hypothetical protein K525DRAFT_361957 [Schizophyllum commune Loenen D]